MPENSEKQNPNESNTNKYRKLFACRFGCKLVCVHDKFSKYFMSYLGKDVVYNFPNNKTEESKCCSDVMKQPFNKKLVINNKDNGDFKNSVGVAIMFMLTRCKCKRSFSYYWKI